MIAPVPVAKPRAAIYARRSTDLQNKNSTADQERIMRERAVRDGCTVVEVYADEAISGTTLDRPGLARLMRDAKARRFDVVYAEALDRMSRSSGGTEHILDVLEYSDVRLVTLSEGEVNSRFLAAIKAAMNREFLAELAKKVRRGQRGAIERGRVPGGKLYGYRIVSRITEDGTVIREREIYEPEAAVVRRAYADYAAGKTPVMICKALNAQGVPAPRGKYWNPATISGSKARGQGILWNETYIGRVVWNRATMRKNPETKKRQPVYHADAAEHVVKEIPALRIIDQATWDAVQAIKTRVSPRRGGTPRRPVRLLAALVVCGVCGGPYVSRSTKHLRCRTHHERGACANGVTVNTLALEGQLLDAVRDRLLTPERLAEVTAEAASAMREARAELTAGLDALRREAAGLDGKIARYVDAIGDGTDTPAMRAALVAAEARKAALAAEIAAAEAEAPEVIDFAPALVAEYRRAVEGLRAGAIRPDSEGGRFLRAIICRLVVEGDGSIAMHGSLIELMDAGARMALGEPAPFKPGAIRLGRTAVTLSRLRERAG
jgi:DNA invertase Pin-like site-specific DNA recombinase